MAWNLPPGCTDADIDRAANGDEPPMDPPTPEEERAEAWEHWHQRAVALEAENFRLRAGFLHYANHTPDCTGNDGSRCACGYLDLWSEIKSRR